MFPIIHNSFYHFTNHVTYFLLPYSTENMLCFPHFEEEPSKLTSYTNTHPEVSQELPQNHLNGNLGSVRKEETRTQKQENETVKPKQKRQKEGKRKSHVQRYGRNICSNILHIIIKKVLYYKQYEKDILKIIEKYGMEIKLQQFYSKLYFKQNKLKEYVPFDKIIEFYTGHKNKIKEGMKRHSEFCKILRIITHLYLQTEHIPVAINCGKLKKQSKHFHIRQSHKLQSILRGTYKLDYKS